MQDNYMDLLQSNSVIDLNESFKNVTQSILLYCVQTLYGYKFVCNTICGENQREKTENTNPTENSVIRRSKGAESAHVRAQPRESSQLSPQRSSLCGLYFS